MQTHPSQQSQHQAQQDPHSLQQSQHPESTAIASAQESTDLRAKVVWVTGAGSGIGEACALAFAKAQARVVLTGRRKQALEAVAEMIQSQGGEALVMEGDMSDQQQVMAIATAIDAQYQALHILVNNAGLNVLERNWSVLSPDRADEVISGNLSSAFYAVIAALPIMRRQGDGLLIHTSSWAGRFVSRVSGPAYSAAKHGVVAMSYAINQEEFRNGIRSTVICPAEVATPILDKRPVPVSAEDRARMLQSEDLARTVLHVASAPKHVCINEIVISPTWNRSYL
ncbi:MAG: SDR family oxidoreductase [Betaproteobacteria bacterium]|nr:SDR family oxidoreductase [Pseudomonadota bacterium]NBO11645.1 SDR family oxidoreductase [Betaproteobacteria bacterium]NBO43178.1 SDR family oxidoreductase [Betaproteobacteria bacterium]NBP09410.1 SDR family oxidoreductase [Betaproteobacteria bacterium]NBP60761.1 SDR family oxidoreductase [Betaproteobacteria bacterium]